MFLLPDDVILHIFARLPLESLIRFKSVREFRHTLFSDRYFIKLNNEESWKKPMVLLVEDNSSRNPMRCVDKSGLSFEFSLGFLNDHVRVRASCNGLLFCSSMKIDRAYYVCNPMTREFKLLPVIEERRLTKIVGLAVDPYTQRYNVVLAVLADSDSSYVLRLFNCLLFDSETNVWKKLVFDSFGTGGGLVYTADQNQVVSVGRSLYCLSVSSKILVFDLFNEAWKEITPPAEIAKSCTSRVLLLELEGSLSVTNILGEWMNIWVLKDCLREEWELADRVNLGSISEFLRETAFPVTLNRDFIFLRTFRDVWVFRRKSRKWNKVHKASWRFHAFPFRSTLCSC